MTLSPISNSNIRVGYISETEGYVKNLSVPDANFIEEKFPNTTFIFIDGDKKIKYLNIDEVNNLTGDDLTRKDPCNIAPVPCGPPDIVFYGGNGIGAEANPVIDSEGQLIAVDIVNGGFGYSTPPNIDVIDPCQNGDGARLIAEILNGSVVNVIVLSTGSGYLAPKSSVPQYPSLVKISEVRVTNSGINYNCGVDELVVEPANGTQLSYNCDPFGRIRSVDILRSGNFTSLPNIRMKTKTGLNAEFIPVFSIERDPLEVEVVTDIVQVFDLVGLNVNGFVNGKEYYGNVYFVNGVKFAGTSAQGGTNIRVFETREASISGVNVPVARVNRVEEDIQTSTTPTTQTITAEPETTRVAPTPPTAAPDSTPAPSPSVAPTPTPSPAPDPTPYTPPSTGGGGGGYGY
tara:strand:- start:1367 stop:2575 length:1209 start_codon:yes stop_codon:yes gene_type:complete